jgi:hypothetical protein
MRRARRGLETPDRTSAAQRISTAMVSVLPMEIQVGDRFTDEHGEWEVISHAVALYGAKMPDLLRQS